MKLIEKACSKCRVSKSLEHFHKNRAATSGHVAQCKLCRANKYQFLSDAALIKQRDNDLRRKYGVGLAEYGELFEKQGGKCAICLTTSPGKGLKYLCVDHNHTTGVVRGLLCQPCNAGIGMLKEQPEILQSAITYLLSFGND